MKEKSKKETPLEPLVEEIMEAGRDLYSCRNILVGEIRDGLHGYVRPKVCPRCGEPYRYAADDVCNGCKEPFVEDI